MILQSLDLGTFNIFLNNKIVLFKYCEGRTNMNEPLMAERREGAR